MFLKKLFSDSCCEKTCRSASTLLLQRKPKDGRAGPGPQHLPSVPFRDAAFSESKTPEHRRSTECSPGFGSEGRTSGRVSRLDSENLKYYTTLGTNELWQANGAAIVCTSLKKKKKIKHNIYLLLLSLFFSKTAVSLLVSCRCKLQYQSHLGSQ